MKVVGGSMLMVRVEIKKPPQFHVAELENCVSKTENLSSKTPCSHILTTGCAENFFSKKLDISASSQPVFQLVVRWDSSSI